MVVPGFRPPSLLHAHTQLSGLFQLRRTTVSVIISCRLMARAPGEKWSPLDEDEWLTAYELSGYLMMGRHTCYPMTQDMGRCASKAGRRWFSVAEGNSEWRKSPRRGRVGQKQEGIV